MSPVRKPFSSWKWAKNSRSRKMMNERSHEGEDSGDLQVREPQSGRVVHRRSHLVPKDETLRKDFSWWRRNWVLQQFVIERGFRSGLMYYKQYLIFVICWDHILNRISAFLVLKSNRLNRSAMTVKLIRFIVQFDWISLTSKFPLHWTKNHFFQDRRGAEVNCAQDYFGHIFRLHDSLSWEVRTRPWIGPGGSGKQGGDFDFLRHQFST